MYVLQTAVEEDLSEEELRIIERGGGRLCSSHHRPQASTVSSATSSAASVATSAGSTTALIRSKRPRPLWRMGPGEQRERNILITAPKLPEIMPKSKEQEMTPFVEPHVEFHNSTVITVEDPQINSYITQVSLPPSTPMQSKQYAVEFSILKGIKFECFRFEKLDNESNSTLFSLVKRMILYT